MGLYSSAGLMRCEEEGQEWLTALQATLSVCACAAMLAAGAVLSRGGGRALERGEMAKVRIRGKIMEVAGKAGSHIFFRKNLMNMTFHLGVFMNSICNIVHIIQIQLQFDGMLIIMIRKKQSKNTRKTEKNRIYFPYVSSKSEEKQKRMLF